MLAMTDAQIESVKQAAALLPPTARDNFMRSVAGALAHTSRPTDRELLDVLRLLLSERGVAVGRAALAIGGRSARSAGRRG